MTAIFLKGNLSDGFRAFGPYKDLSEAADRHDFEEGWLMTLEASPFCPKCGSLFALHNGDGSCVSDEE